LVQAFTHQSVVVNHKYFHGGVGGVWGWGRNSASMTRHGSASFAFFDVKKARLRGPCVGASRA
jgi:hypothetical protein